jgi:hypothetical protein
MTTNEILIVIVYIIELISIGIFYNLYKHYRAKHDEAINSWTIESSRKDEQILKLQEELRTYKDMERVIKIERVTIQPRELECKFMLHERFVDDTELFKKVITSEVARYLAEEIERDPYLCKVFHSVNSFDCTENIMVHFRMLPYAEGVAWDDIFKEETR